MNRIDNFSELFNHAFYRKKAEKLTKKEMIFCVGFISMHQSEDRAAYKNLCQKVFITGPQSYDFGGEVFTRKSFKDVHLLAEILMAAA